MANQIYGTARELYLTSGGLNWTSDTIKAVLVDTGAYTPDFVLDDFLADIAAGARIATSAALSSKTVTGGVADAADVVFTAVSGVSVEAIVLYKDTGLDTTSNLIAYIDTATGLPVTPSGGDITITWDAAGIFRL